MKTICVFGASITYGAWDRELGGWVNRLRLYFDNSDEEFIVSNRAVDGDTTRGLLKYFETDCKAVEPDIIIFDMGTNDSMRIKNNLNVPIEEFQSNLKKLIEKAKKFSNKIIFIGITKVDESKTMPVPWGDGLFYDNEIALRYDSIIKKICKENNILFIEMFDLLNEKDLEDGIHPTSKGHEKMFQRVKDSLIKNRII